ncbi:hypothetical protein HBH71_168650 [Parastagonospora nodorum]|nr:hypothetical protein HBH71_168650 [Parastagonospora nodorum]KAH6003871.1 hypothetical protein HBI83_197470 [Parastagonospora nodorum]KAH6366311.1 hypothetical protein HBI34_147850 [Parastagonospora nodorum]
MESDTNSIVGSQTKSEVKLVLELTDIIDELNSINHLFEAQRDTLDTTLKSFDNSDWFAPEEDRYKLLTEELSTMITQYMESCMKQVKRMTANAQRTKDCLKDLLDLQQKEETLNEAHYSHRRPGNDMYKNGNEAASSLSAAPAAVEPLGAL